MRDCKLGLSSSNMAERRWRSDLSAENEFDAKQFLVFEHDVQGL
jgi:hypothetical protein